MPNDSIHTTLAHSYLTYFICSIVGLFIDTLIGFTINVRFGNHIAIICFLTGTLLIAWAQYTSRHTHVQTSTPYFFRGPYRYMRNPTHLGIVILVTGYTVVSGSLVFFAVTVIGYLISNIFFHQYEAILDRTYGGEYKTYQAKVPKIF